MSKKETKSEALYNCLTSKYNISARKYFWVLRLAIYHIDGKELNTSFETTQYAISDEVYKTACDILTTLYEGRKEMTDSNTIFNDMDETIGYYNDLKKLLQEQAVEAVKQEEYEQASMICDDLLELYELRDYAGLIVLSDNNGMGFTAKPYKEETKK